MELLVIHGNASNVRNCLLYIELLVMHEIACKCMEFTVTDREIYSKKRFVVRKYPKMYYLTQQIGQ